MTHRSIVAAILSALGSLAIATALGWRFGWWLTLGAVGAYLCVAAIVLLWAETSPGEGSPTEGDGKPG